MHTATEEETHRFLQGLWFEWGSRVLHTIAHHYNLSEDQTDALLTILLRPNDWVLERVD